MADNNIHILTIDTTKPEKTAILLAESKDDNYQILSKKTWAAKTHQSEELLPEIDRMLIKSKIKVEEVDLIIVCIGPGSFTGIRVGATTANALSLGLNIPVIGIKRDNESIGTIFKKGFSLYKNKKYKKGDIAIPFYDKTPNITLPKNK